jgi:Restriction endonuclease
LGLGRIYVQAKWYATEKAVERPETQESVGTLHGAHTDRGIFITTTRFTPEAVTYSDRVAARGILHDGLALRGLMVRYNIGVQDQQTYVIKRIDEDFFDENLSSRRSDRGTGRGTGCCEIPVQSVLPMPSVVLSVQVTPREQATGPLVMRRSSVRFR